MSSRLERMAFAAVYPLYVQKVERKGRTKDELDEVLRWLTGYEQHELEHHIAASTPLPEFFEQSSLNPNASLITGVVCGVRVETIEDPFMQKLRYMDKLVDELAKGKAMAKVLRA